MIPVTNGVARPSGLTRTTETGVCFPRGPEMVAYTIPERLTAGLVTGCSPSASWRATRTAAAFAAPGRGTQLDQARRSVSGHPKSQPRRPAHQDLRRFAIHVHHGQSELVRAEIDAGYLDFAQRQCRRRHHVVHPRQWNRLRHGLMR